MASDSLPPLFDAAMVPGQGDPIWPLAGYAPGEYVGRCSMCQKQVLGIDKYAIHCLPCAIISVKRASQVLADSNKEITERYDKLVTAVSTIKELFK